MTAKRCTICGDVLQRWEIGYHADCVAPAAPDYDWLEWQDEANERMNIREQMIVDRDGATVTRVAETNGL